MYNKKLLNKATKDLNKIKRPYTGMRKPRGLKIPKQQPSSSPTNFESESYKLEEGGTMNSKEHGIDLPFYIDVEEKKSPIHGTGIFTKQPLSKDQPIGISHIRKTWEKNGQMLTGPVPSKHIAGYNHSETPNVKEVDVGSHITLVAIKDIQPGEELVVDYTVNTSSDLEHPDDFKNKDLEKANGGKILKGKFNFKNPFKIKVPKFPQVINPNAPFIKPGTGSIIKKGRSVSVEDANKIIQNIAKEFPNTNVENAPVFYHGTNSSALQGIQTVEGLTNLTNLAHLGITPMAGELSTGAKGVNKQGISTAFVDNLNSATRYSMANGLLKTPVEDFQEWWGNNRLNYFGESQYFPKTEYYDNLYNQRLENYESLVGDEKSFIDNKFPMLFGIHPKHGDHTRFKVPSSDIQSETVIKDLISFDEIPNLFVPKSKIDLVSDYLNAHKNNVHISDIEPFINRKGVLPWVSQLYNKQNYKDGGPTVKQRRGVRKNPDGTVSSHLMKAEYIPGRGWVGFPTLFQDSKPYADDQQNWVDMSEEAENYTGEWKDSRVFKEAERRGEVYDFGKDKKAAVAFGEGSWKDQLPEREGENESISSPEAWEQEIRRVEKEIGNPSGWTMDSYSMLQDKLNEYKAWREKHPEVVDHSNKENEYVVPLPSHLNKPYNIERARELGYESDETGHLPSVDNQTGMWLKSMDHPTAWKEYMYGQLNKDIGTNTRVVVNPEGYFGDNQLQYIQTEADEGEIQKYVDGGYIVEEVKLPKAKFGFGVPKLPNGIPKLPNGFKGFKGIDISKPKSLGNLTTNQLENILKYADVSDAYQNNVVNSEQLKAVIKAGENAHAQLFDDKVVSYLAQNSEDPMKFTVPGENFDLDAIRALPQHIAYHALHGSNISNMLRNSVEDYVRDPYAMFDLNFENDLEKMSELNGGTIRFPIKEVYHGFGSDADFNFENLELDRSKIPVEKLKTNTTTGKSSKFANWKLGEDIIGPRSKHQFGLYASYNLQGLRDPASSYSDNALSNSLALRLRPEEALKDTRSLIKNIELDDNVKLLHVGYKDENNNLKVKEIFRDILDIGKDNIGLPTFAGGISGDLNLTPKAAKRLKEKYDYDGLIYPSFGELVITNKDVIKGVKDRDFKMFDYQNPLDYYMSSLRTSNANLDKMLNVTGGLRNLTTLNDYYHPEYSRFRLPKDGPSRAWPQIEVPSYWPTDDPSSKRLQDELLGNWFRQKFAWNRGASDNVSSSLYDKDHPDFPIKDREYTYPFDESWYEKLHPENLPFIKKEGGELLKANGGKIIKNVLKPPKSPIKTRIGTNLKNLNLTKNSYFSDINNAISFYKPRIDNIVNEQLKWIESPEYIKRREATTGESKEEIVNSVKKQSEILNLIDLNKSFNIKPLSEGVLGSAQVNNKSFLGNKIFGAKPQINLDQNMFFTDPLQTLGTAKHETIHLSDPFFYSGTEFPFETAYNNYPFLNIDKPNLTFGQKFMNKFIDPSLPNNLISNKDLKEELSDWEYNIDKMEQKVRFKKLNDVIRQDLGLGKMYGSQPQLTIDNINKWISDRGTPLELSNYLDNSGLYDVNALLKGHSKSKDYSRTNLLDQLNKAWGLAAPLGLGLGYTMDEDSDSSYKYGGSLPKAKWGISGASWPPKFNLPFHSGLKYNKNGSISKIYNPYFKKWQEPRANVNALNELLNIGHANRELANEWNIRDINNIAKKSLQIIDPKKYDKESTLEYVKWHQEFAKLKESTIDKVADLKLEGNPLPPHEQRDLYEKFNSWLSVNTPPLQLDHMRNTSYSGLRDLSDKSKELVNRQIDDLNPHFDNFNIRKKYDLGINNMFKKLSFLEKLKSFRPKHDFGSSMYDSIAEDYNNVRDVWERDYPSINKEREMLEKLREYDLSTEPSQQKMIDDYQELFHNIMTPLQHTDIDLPNDGDELIGFQNGGVVELGDEVDEPTMQRLKKQGYTFEKV